MYNQVLWTLDNETNDIAFERLCTDILGREGYSDIVPIGGGHDRGRDAEIRHWKGIKLTGGITFFQYSLEDTWESKLKKELIKIKNNQHTIDYFVFVTSQKVTGDKRDKLAAAVKNDYGWELIIYDREWLRHRLEEKHPDLATKYLGIGITSPNSSEKGAKLIENPFDEKVIPFHYKEGEYDRAIAEIKQLMKTNGEKAKVLQALAWYQYRMFYYTDALANINRSLSLDDKDDVSWAIKASILTEDGIQKGIKANLLLARDIFERIAKSSNRWIDHFNYGNTLHALGNHKGARDEFRKALDIDNKQAMVWKNLGTVYYHLRNHKEEIKCYNKALSIDGKLAEALASKGITLLVIYKDAKKASVLLEEAIMADISLANHWPHIWYWLGKAYKKTGNFLKVLENTQNGLNISPSHLGLLNLKAIALSHLWQQDKTYIEESIIFFKFRVELSSDDHDSLVELIKLYLANGNDAEATALVAKLLGIKTIDPLEIINQTNIKLNDFLLGLRYTSSYKKFRSISSIDRYKAVMEESSLAIHEDFEEILFTVCIVPFGLACNLLSQAKKMTSKKIVSKLYTVTQNSIKAIFPQLGKFLAKEINTGTQEKTIEDMSKIIATFPLISLLEFSGVTGFATGIFGLSISEVNDALNKEGENLSRWQAQIASETFIEVNKEVKLVKE